MASEDGIGEFADVLDRRIKSYGDPKATGHALLDRQRDQFETLAALEEEFRTYLIDHGWVPLIYGTFVRKVCQEEGDVLDARPYFRIRATEFSATLSPALKQFDLKTVSTYHINHQFVAFALRVVSWNPRSRVHYIANKIKALRCKMIETNMPMAIKQARRFWRRTTARHLNLSDLVQISTEGLIAAIDKFCLPFRQMWRSVALYRMIGDQIENYSKTVLHFYPRDKKRLYRANHVLARHPDGGLEVEDLLSEVNRDAEPGQEVNASELADLLAAATVFSADTPSSSIDTPSSVARYAGPDSDRPDVRVEQEELVSAALRAVSGLTLWERKLVRLYGGLDIPLA